MLLSNSIIFNFEKAFANKNDPEPAQATVQSMDDPK
jgi:hypothetical protein